MTLIAVNVAAVNLETVDPLHARYDQLFRLVEIGSVAVFSAEYVARIWWSRKPSRGLALIDAIDLIREVIHMYN
jgi:hypothetical protein